MRVAWLSNTWTQIAGATLIPLAVSAIARPAGACSCIPEAVSVDWPAPGATDLPIDTAILLETYGEGVVLAAPGDPAAASPDAPSDAATARTFDAGREEPQADLIYLKTDGESGISLELVLRLRNEALCSDGKQVVRATSQLLPFTTYQVMRGAEVLSTFTTGNTLSDAQAERDAVGALSWHPLGESYDPSLILSAYVLGQTSQPILFHYKGLSAEVTVLVETNPLVESALQVDFGGVHCPSVELYSVQGELLETRELCSPERCYTAPTLGWSSCGGNPFLSMDFAQFATDTVACDAAAPDPNEPPNPVGTVGSSAVGSPTAPDAGQTAAPHTPDTPSAPATQALPAEGMRAIDDGAASGCGLSAQTTRHAGSFTWLSFTWASVLFLRRKARPARD